jgi:hypothetical protein
VRLSHTLARTSAVFDNPDLLSHGGLALVVALAERGGCGVNAPLKAGCLVAGMAAGAGSIDDKGLLRHGAMGVLFSGTRAPSTLGSHLRSYTWGTCCSGLSMEVSRGRRRCRDRRPRPAGHPGP